MLLDYCYCPYIRTILKYVHHFANIANFYEDSNYNDILLIFFNIHQNSGFTRENTIILRQNFTSFLVFGKKHSVYSLVRNSSDRKLFFNDRSIGIQFASTVSVFRLAFIAFIVFFDCSVIHLVFSGKICKIRLDF